MPETDSNPKCAPKSLLNLVQPIIQFEANELGRMLGQEKIAIEEHHFAGLVNHLVCASLYAVHAGFRQSRELHSDDQFHRWISTDLPYMHPRTVGAQ